MIREYAIFGGADDLGFCRALRWNDESRDFVTVLVRISTLDVGRDRRAAQITRSEFSAARVRARSGK